jgi:spermidine synthase
MGYKKDIIKLYFGKLRYGFTENPRMPSDHRERLYNSRIIRVIILFFTSFALLSYEIFLTRIISALFLKYFSVLAISMAMAGLGISGVLVQILSDRGRKINGERALFGVGCALVGSLVFLPFYVVFFHIPNYLLTTIDLFRLLVFVTVCILPFFFGGIILSGAYHRFPGQVERIYAADLLGAGCGTLSAFFALRFAGGFSSILFSAIPGALALVMISRSSRPARRFQASAILVITVCFFLIQNFYSPLKFPHPSRKPGVNRFAKWSEMGLTTVARFSGFTGEGLSEKTGLMDPHIFKFISHDYNSSTMAVNPALAQREISKITSQISSFPFHFKTSSNVLVLGAGGGKEVYSALASGVEMVTAVEFNRVIVEDIMLGELEDFSGGLYKKERVRVVVDEARNYLRRTDERFDVIVPVMGSTPGLVAAGCYLFSTEYLQTREAYQNYLAHLSDRGIFSFVCFFKEEDYKNRLGNHYRVLATIKETLLKNGLDPTRHMMVVGGKTVDDKLYSHAACVVFSPSVFSKEDAQRARNIARDMGFDLIYSPYEKKDVLISRFIETADTEKFYSFSPVDIKPVSDDRPFYYDYRKNGAGESGRAESEYINLIYSMVLIFAFYVLIILLLPLIFFRRLSPPRSKGNTLRGLGYFLCLGAGFAAMELT